MRRIKKKKAALIALAVLAAALFVWVVGRDPLNAEPSRFRSVLLKNTLVQDLLPTYHSLRKLPDLLFLPYAFYRTALPVYKFTLQPLELLELIGKLPSDPISGQLTNEERVYVSAYMESGGFKSEVKLRYRGTSAHHWNSFQKSFKVKLPKQTVLRGADGFNFIIPYDRGYFVEPLNFYRAKKLGVTALPMHFGRVIWNGEDMGVYLVSPNWSGTFLDGATSPLIVYGADDARGTAGSSKNDTSSSITLQTPGDPIYLSNYTGRSVAGSLEALLSLIYHADDEAFKTLIGTLVDLPKFYAWNIVNILAGSEHYDDTFGNLFLIFDPTTGKFQLSPWDPGLRAVKTGEGQYQDDRMRLARRILRVPEFRAERDRLLKAYLQDDANLADDLAFYDGLYAKTKSDFLSDNAKLYNNFQFLAQVAGFRKLIIQNFRDASLVFAYDTKHYANAKDEGALHRDELRFTGSFARLAEAAYTASEFLARNPSFLRGEGNTVVLPSGNHTFLKDVIIPSGLRLSIDSGAALYLGEAVSLLSHSPVRGEGGAERPIRIRRAYPEKAWGVFGVVNAPEESVFRYVEAAGGSGATVLGATFTGMVSFLHSDVRVAHSLFSEAGDDDAFNAKYAKVTVIDSLFRDNDHDGVDLDWPEAGSEITGSHFLNNGIGGGEGGDAIDLSRSNLPIRRNFIDGCTDKGISIGERSYPVITGNIITHCPVGIAVKDLSEALIASTSISHAAVGIDAYRKHPVYGGGTARVSRVRMENVKEEYRTDAFSTIETTP